VGSMVISGQLLLISRAILSPIRSAHVYFYHRKLQDSIVSPPKGKFFPWAAFCWENYFIFDTALTSFSLISLYNILKRLYYSL